MSADVSLEAIARSKLSELAPERRCDDGCPGWAVFNGNEIQSCDACWHGTEQRLTDDEAAALPEAQAALTLEIKLVHKAEHGTCYGMFAEWCPHCLVKLSWLKRRAA